MINFDTELDRAYETRIKVVTQVPPVREKFTVRPVTSPRPAPLPPADQGWEELKDYVMGQITEQHPWVARDSRRENTVFMGFHGRWQALALPIARYAFEDEPGGFWMGAPIGVFRFEPTSDECFAKVIAARL